jgi:fatty acid desaturase
MLRPEEVRALSVPSAAGAIRAAAIDWAVIAAGFAVAIRFPHPLIWIACYLLMSRQQLALAILMHDGAHRRLMKSARANDLFCQFVCAAPLFFSMYSYQKLHLKHHREPLAPDDPDLSLIGGYPIPLSSFLRKLARDASGLSYYKFIRYFIYMARKPKSPQTEARPEREVGPRELKSQGAGSRLSMTMIVFSILIVNLILWSVLFALGHGWMFPGLWVLPAVTFLQVLLRIRGIAEHAGYQPNPDQSLNARTVLGWQTVVFAPHNVNYHIEHHVYPAVPFYNLPKLHALMMERGLVPAANIYSGYGQILRELIRSS